MRELRLSIPFIGGITAVYHEHEVKEKVAQTKKAVGRAASATRRGLLKVAVFSKPAIVIASKGLGSLATWIESKQ